MKTFKEKMRNRLIYNKSEIAIELESSSEGLRRWIAIYPRFEDPVDQSIPDHAFSILDFELSKDLVDEYFGEEDKVNQKRRYVNNEEELYSALALMGVNPEDFDAPWNCDYPL